MQEWKSVCISVSLVAGLLGSIPALAEPITFAYRTDGNPVSYPEAINKVPTGRVAPDSFCGKLALHLQSLNYQFEFKEERFDYRFKTFIGDNKLEGRPLIECGPNSLTRKRIQDLQEYGLTYSEPFMVTDLRLLIRKDMLATLDKQPDQVVIAVLAASKTTNKPSNKLPQLEKSDAVTSALIGDFYPKAILDETTYKSRLDILAALKKVDQPVIHAYASDYAILHEIWKNELGAAADHYVIEPAINGFSREEYRVFVYNDDLLLDRVNKWISSPDGVEARRALEPKRDWLQEQLAALNHQPNLQWAYYVLSGVLALFLLLVAITLILLARARRTTMQPPSPVFADQLAELSRDLHDKAIQPLVGTKLFINVALSSLTKDPAACKQHLDKSLNALDEGIHEIRQLSHKINQQKHPQPDKIDLLLQQFAETTAINVNINKTVRWEDLPLKHAEHIHAILSEALTNIQKYAEANRVFIRLDKFGKRLQLEIHDDGKGMDTSKLSLALGIGIRNMQERVKELRGEFAIHGGMGTRIQISLPC